MSTHPNPCEGTQPTLAEAVHAPTDAFSGPSRRRALWQLDTRVRCAIIGTCLSSQDLRELLPEHERDYHRTTPEFDIYRAFVQLTARPSADAAGVNRYLDLKFQRHLGAVEALSVAGEYSALWEEALRQGTVAGPFWALFSYADTPRELLDRAFGDVHLLSQLAGASMHCDVHRQFLIDRRLSDAEQAKRCLETACRRQLRLSDERISALIRRVRELEAQLGAGMAGRGAADAS